MHRLSIRLFESGFTSPTTTPNWNSKAKVRSVRWEYNERYLRQEFESDLPFEVKFTAKIGDGEISCEMISELVEDHIISRYTVLDDNEADIDSFYDQPCDESEIPDMIDRIIAREEAYNQAVYEERIFSDWYKAITEALNELFEVDEDDDSRDWSDLDEPVDLDSIPSQEEMKKEEPESPQEEMKKEEPESPQEEMKKEESEPPTWNQKPDLDEFYRRVFQIFGL